MDGEGRELGGWVDEEEQLPDTLWKGEGKGGSWLG